MHSTASSSFARGRVVLLAYCRWCGANSIHSVHILTIKTLLDKAGVLSPAGGDAAQQADQDLIDALLASLTSEGVLVPDPDDTSYPDTWLIPPQGPSVPPSGGPRPPAAGGRPSDPQIPKIAALARRLRGARKTWKEVGDAVAAKYRRLADDTLRRYARER